MLTTRTKHSHAARQQQQQEEGEILLRNRGYLRMYACVCLSVWGADNCILLNLNDYWVFK